LDNGILVLEGEYLNDIPWKVTIYDSDGNVLEKISHNFKEEIRQYIIYGHKLFEGECLNGERNGKGKEYYSDGTLKFEGEYLKDKKWNGKGFNSLNEVLYELKNGKGLVKEYDDDKLIFEGEYLNGEKNGKGKEYDPNSNLIYEGEFLNGKRNGIGKLYDGKLRFEGIFLYDFIIKGKLYINEKFEFEGEYLYNKKWNGKGYDENGNIIYELINGYGNIKDYNNLGQLLFEGKCINGKVYKGIVIEYYSTGEVIFKGEYLNGEIKGKGKEYYLNGELKFEGEYLNGKRNGKGKEYWDNGELKFKGEYLNGKRNGKGKKFNRYGELEFKGEYLNGKRI